MYLIQMIDKPPTRTLRVARNIDCCNHDDDLDETQMLKDLQKSEVSNTHAI